MPFRKPRLFLLTLTLFLHTLVFAQNPAPSSHEMQNMPGTQNQSNQKPDASQAHPMQSMPANNLTDTQLDDQKMDSQVLGPPLKISDLERMALNGNPTISQAEAVVRSAGGAERQAGFYPNPTMGYYGDEIRGGSYRSGKQGGFVNQTIVLGGKLGAARRTAEQEKLLALTGVDSQRLRVLTDVRTFFYKAIAAQRLVSVRQQLLALAKDAERTSYQLGNVGQADRPDILQSEVEADQATLDLEAARQDQQALWRTLAAVVGNPDLPMSPLEGNLEDIPQLNAQEWTGRILSESPQVKSAQQEAERAKAALVEAKKVSIPDLQISANLSQDNEPLEPLKRRVGIVGGAQIGVQLPIFNHNQGNTEKAKADIQRSQKEVQRVQLELRRQMSAIFRDYGVARMSAKRYRTSMLPRAQKAYDLYRSSYEKMAAAYPQVLISQRTLFQLQVDYIRALEAVWVNATAIQGFTLSDGLSAPGPLGGGSSSTMISKRTAVSSGSGSNAVRQ